MSTITFDTLKFANRLKAAGVPDKQAEAEAEVLAEALEVNLKDLSTKADLMAAKVELQQEMKMLEQRLIIKLGTLIALSIGIVAALVKLLVTLEESAFEGGQFTAAGAGLFLGLALEAELLVLGLEDQFLLASPGLRFDPPGFGVGRLDRLRGPQASHQRAKDGSADGSPEGHRHEGQ